MRLRVTAFPETMNIYEYIFGCFDQFLINFNIYNNTLIIIDKQRFISNVLETSQFLRKIKQQTSFLLKN